jgi:hypothetical protein
MKSECQDSLPLKDLNGDFVRMVSLQEAAHMVDSGQASAIVPGNWRDRTDIPWEGIQLIVQCDPNWSPTSLGMEDAMKAAGLIDSDSDWEAKWLLWRYVGDTKATRVRR